MYVGSLFHGCAARVQGGMGGLVGVLLLAGPEREPHLTSPWDQNVVRGLVCSTKQRRTHRRWVGGTKGTQAKFEKNDRILVVPTYGYGGALNPRGYVPGRPLFGIPCYCYPLLPPSLQPVSPSKPGSRRSQSVCTIVGGPA